MKSAIDCLRKMSNRQYGCDVGLIVALHTWGQRLNRHVHVHVSMTAGGVSEDENSWVPISTSDPQMQPQALADAFRKMYLHRLKHRHTAGKLTRLCFRIAVTGLVCQCFIRAHGCLPFQR